jgi:hypothetical protein
VGVGNPAEETYCHPNTQILCPRRFLSIPRQRVLRILIVPECLGFRVSGFWFRVGSGRAWCVFRVAGGGSRRRPRKSKSKTRTRRRTKTTKQK